MKRFLVAFWGITIVLSIYGCDGGGVISSEDTENIVLSKYDFSISDTVLFAKCSIVSLETNDNSLISNINRLVIHDDTLFVFDDRLNEVLIFDINGHFINKIHDIGEGPTEYIQLTDLGIDTQKRRIILSCDRPEKIMYYTYDGKFLDEFKLLNYVDELSIDGNCLYGYKYDVKGNVNIPIYDRTTMKLIKTLKLNLGKSIKMQTSGNVFRFGKGNMMTKSNDIYFTRQFDNSIYTIENEGICRKYNIDFGKYNLPLNLLEADIMPTDFMKICAEKEYVCLVSDVMENESYLFFRTDLGLFFYDKGNNQLIGCRAIHNTCFRGKVFDFLSTNNENKIIGILEPDWVKRTVEYNMKKTHTWKSENPDIYELYETIDDESNPILLIYEFK